MLQKCCVPRRRATSYCLPAIWCDEPWLHGLHATHCCLPSFSIIPNPTEYRSKHSPLSTVKFHHGCVKGKIANPNQIVGVRTVSIWYRHQCSSKNTGVVVEISPHPNWKWWFYSTWPRLCRCAKMFRPKHWWVAGHEQVQTSCHPFRWTKTDLHCKSWAVLFCRCYISTQPDAIFRPISASCCPVHPMKVHTASNTMC